MEEKKKNFNNNQIVDKSKVTCSYCNKFDHDACDFKKRITCQGKKRDNVSTKNNYSMFLSFHTMNGPYDNVCLLDSGCSCHMVGNKNLVTNLDESVKLEIKLGTKKSMDVDGK